MLHAISSWRGSSSSKSAATSKPTGAERTAYRRRLGASRAADRLLARTCSRSTAHRYGDTERAAVLVRNLEDGVKLERAVERATRNRWPPRTGDRRTLLVALVRRPGGDDGVRAAALVTIDPENTLVEPAMNWLVKNRRGAQWNNTRDTAIALLALNDYLRAQRRAARRRLVRVDGKRPRRGHEELSAADVLRAPSRFTVDAAIARGDHAGDPHPPHQRHRAALLRRRGDDSSRSRNR